jgi:hypothetical protein
VKQTTQTPEAEGKNSAERGIPAYSEETILFDVGSVCEHLSRLTDGRKARGKRYTLTTVWVVTLMAKLSGEDRPAAIAEWGKHRAEGLATMLGLKRVQMPHATTYGRVLRKAINPDQFERKMNAYFLSKSSN